jgi:hypothetical protein
MHIDPTVSEFIPTMMDKLKPLQSSGSAEFHDRGCLLRAIDHRSKWRGGVDDGLAGAS